MDLRHDWSALEKDDTGLRTELMQLLTGLAVGDPYSSDGSFAANLARLSPRLRAMAATHWLDVSLTLDSMTWHFGNFGEPGLVAETEAGLRELDLPELADCFAEAKELMTPVVAHWTEADGDPFQILERAGSREHAQEIDRRASALSEIGPGESVIHRAWITYTRQRPDRVFGPAPSSPSTTPS